MLVQFVVATLSAGAKTSDSQTDPNGNLKSEQKSEAKLESKMESKSDSTVVSVSKAAVDGILSTVSAPTTMQLDQIERDAFSHSYSTDTSEQRVCRLEQFVFGKQFSGDLAKRFKKVRSALAPKEIEKAISPTTGSESSSTDAGEKKAKVYDFPTLIKKPAEAPPPPEPTKTHVGLIDVMNRGIDNYNVHKYTNAEDDFEECCAMAPGMSRCFAYLAITKMQLNLRQAAIDSFRTSFMLDPFGNYGRYAKSCLVTLAGDEAMRKRPPVDSKQVLDVAMSNIDKQSSDISSRHQAQANQVASARIGYRPDGMMIDSRIQSNNARIEGALRAAHTVESANNLKHMLAVKKMPGDANLRAWGTTLTTRYYGNETYLNAPYYIPKERPMELKAIVRSLQSMHSKNNHAPSAVHSKGTHKSSKTTAAHKKHSKRG
ncbi:MAG: hypothetical protein JST89_00870 [Cyanobacteria bacterium SZAS-4]|nr:hypothetical protein [Cyanobacteria bacterium SZAS-4]